MRKCFGFAKNVKINLELFKLSQGKKGCENSLGPWHFLGQINGCGLIILRPVLSLATYLSLWAVPRRCLRLRYYCLIRCATNCDGSSGWLLPILQLSGFTVSPSLLNTWSSSSQQWFENPLFAQTVGAISTFINTWVQKRKTSEATVPVVSLNSSCLSQIRRQFH